MFVFLTKKITLKMLNTINDERENLLGLGKIHVCEINPGSLLYILDHNDINISSSGLFAERSFVVILSKVGRYGTPNYYDITYICLTVYFSCSVIVNTYFFVNTQKNYCNTDVFTYNGMLLH